jgi:hypothetical protein
MHRDSPALDGSSCGNSGTDDGSFQLENLAVMTTQLIVSPHMMKTVRQLLVAAAQAIQVHVLQS